MSIGEFCNREVIVAHRDEGIHEIARIMREHHVGDVVIVDDSTGVRRPIGILTDRDLVVEVLAQEAPAAELTAGDVMTVELLTARESDGLWETLQRMKAHGVRRVPVVDDTGALVGIVSADDLFELLAEEMNDLVRVIRREISREQETRR